MLFGIHVFPTEHSIQPGELARAVEERGLESIWFSEHTHIPVHFLRTTERGRALPEYYWQTYDLFVALTLAAASTEKIKLGTGVSLVIERDPIILANAVATLDRWPRWTAYPRGASFLALVPAGLKQRWLIMGLSIERAFNF